MFYARRLKKQELASFAQQSAEDVLRAVEESVKRELHKQSVSEAIVDEPSKPHNDRTKIIISIQDKHGLRQFRIYSVCSLLPVQSVWFWWNNISSLKY